MTNAHVVGTAELVSIRQALRRWVGGVAHRSATTDLAFVFVPDLDLPAAELRGTMFRL